MNNLLPKELELEKLEQIANGWVEEYGGYIAGISFFCSKETSGSNVKEYQYCIDFVLCDPPRIEPVSRFSSGFIAKEAGVMSVRLLGLIPDSTNGELEYERLKDRFDTAITPQQKKEMEFLSQWRIDIRWETDQPDPSYIPESKQILYSRPKNQPSKQIEFSPEDYERLKRLPSFNLEECIGLMLRMPYEQTIVAIQKGELDIQTASQVHKKISEYTELLSRSIHDGELKPKENTLDSTLADPAFKPQVFFKWAKKKGFEIPIGNPIKTDDMKVEVLNHALSVSKNNSASTGPEKAEIDPDEKISRVLIKGWQPEHLIERLSKQRELAIWNSWIKPIVILHYKGVFEYKYFKEPESLNRYDLEAMWEQHIAPFICSNLPQWIKYPQSVTQAELESCISENLWEPDLFVSEILLLLKAGRGADFVDPFFRCLRNIMTGGDLPSFLAYIDQKKREDIIKTDPTERQKLRPDQEDRQTCQDIAASLWNEYEILDLKHMINLPDIQKIAGNGKLYKEKTLRKWLSEIAPERAKKPGIRPPEVRKKQDKICKEIGISI
jgi:hypothetical protein